MRLSFTILVLVAPLPDTSNVSVLLLAVVDPESDVKVFHIDWEEPLSVLVIVSSPLEPDPVITAVIPVDPVKVNVLPCDIVPLVLPSPTPSLPSWHHLC